MDWFFFAEEVDLQCSQGSAQDRQVGNISLETVLLGQRSCDLGEMGKSTALVQTHFVYHNVLDPLNLTAKCRRV